MNWRIFLSQVVKVPLRYKMKCYLFRATKNHCHSFLKVCVFFKRCLLPTILSSFHSFFLFFNKQTFYCSLILFQYDIAKLKVDTHWENFPSDILFNTHLKPHDAETSNKQSVIILTHDHLVYFFSS